MEILGKPFNFIMFFLFLFLYIILVNSELNPAEQDSVYQILESINSEIPWRSDFPDDLCDYPPHGVICDLFENDVVHVTELNFGYVSDYSANPPCSLNSTIKPQLFNSLHYLRKLFFYKCFTETTVLFPDFSSLRFLQELVFIENPALVGSIGSSVDNLKNLKRFIVTGSNVSGEFPLGFGNLINIEEITLSRNRFSGGILLNFSKLENLKILDLGFNGFSGDVPESIGDLSGLLKLDLSMNQLSGKIPESLRGLKDLEFMDLSYNRFTNSGIPLFLGDLKSLKEVYLSGNFLGGQIPEIWKNLGGVIRIGLSNTGLTGKIPNSMGVFLDNLSYLGLDNNNLEGELPNELGLLELVHELNLENNSLSGKIPFSAEFASKLGAKLKLKGNPDLCVDGRLRSVSRNLQQMKICSSTLNIHRSVMVLGDSSGCLIVRVSYVLMFLGFLLLFS